MKRLEIQLDEWEAATLKSAALRSGVEPETMARRLLGRQLSLYADHMTDRMLGLPGQQSGEAIEMRLLHLFEA